MFRRKKIVHALTHAEHRLLTSAMLSFRNKLLSSGKPTEDVNELRMLVAQDVAREKQRKRRKRKKKNRTG